MYLRFFQMRHVISSAPLPRIIIEKTALPPVTPGSIPHLASGNCCMGSHPDRNRKSAEFLKPIQCTQRSTFDCRPRSPYSFFLYCSRPTKHAQVPQNPVCLLFCSHKAADCMPPPLTPKSHATKTQQKRNKNATSSPYICAAHRAPPPHESA